MPTKAAVTAAVIVVAATFLSFRPFSPPAALAKPHASQEGSAGPLALPAAPPNWSLTAYACGACGNKAASATRPAGGSGVKHVASCISFSAYVTPTTSQPLSNSVVLRDGASGTGTVVFRLDSYEPPGNGFVQSVCGLNIVGSADTAMTIEFLGINSYIGQDVNLIGYDAQ